MKLKYLLAIFSLLIFAGCKKSISPDNEAPTSKKGSGYETYSYIQSPKNSVSTLNEGDVYFIATLGHNSAPCYVTLYPEAGGNPITDPVHFIGDKKSHTYTLPDGTRFFIRTISESGATFESQVVVAGTIGGVTITAP